MCGSDLRQGGHQVAQKSTTTTFFFRSESLTFFPSSVSKAISGAGFPSAGAAATSFLSSANALGWLFEKVRPSTSAAAGTSAYIQWRRFIEDSSAPECGKKTARHRPVQ